MLNTISLDLKRRFNDKLVDELLAAYQDAKENFYLGGLRLSAVEGGRFCEAAFRMLEEATSGAFTPINAAINTEHLISLLAKLPKSSFSDSIRVHIPRSLRVVYDIRNKRDAAHLADNIDPNVQDGTLVICVMDWILVEFVRLYHGVPADEAQRIIDGLVARRAPAVQDFDGFQKYFSQNCRSKTAFCYYFTSAVRSAPLFKSFLAGCLRSPEKILRELWRRSNTTRHTYTEATTVLR